MKIFIKHLSDTLNYGSMMMGENLIYYLNKQLGEYKPEFYIDAKDEFHVERLKEATKYNNIHLDKIFNYKLITEKIKFVRYIERKIRLCFLEGRATKYYDAIIILGGDDFSEIYFNLPKDNIAIKNVLKQLDKFNKKSKLYMIGQTIGPYTGVRKEWAKKYFKDINIYARDDKSAMYMEEELNKKVIKSRDLAFLNLCLQEEYEKKHDEILKKYDLNSDDYITFVGTGLVHLYSKNVDDVFDSIVKIIETIKNKYPNKKLVWLSHVVTRNNVNDNSTLDKINKKYDGFIDKNMIVIKEEILPVEARIILGHGLFTVTCRMHAAVSTFQMNKPALCLSYSSKYKGVIGDGLDMNELVIEAKSEEIWKNQIIDIVNEKIEYIDKNYQKLIEKIHEKNKECQAMVYNTIDEISKEISEDNK